MNPSAETAMFSWSHDRAEIIADGIIHAIGIALGVAGAAFLLLSAFHTARDGEIASVIIYVVGLLSMLGVSAAYNSWPVSPHKWMLRRFDHSAIYLLIASTYTPFLLHMKNGTLSATMLVTVWLTASVGNGAQAFLAGTFRPAFDRALPGARLERSVGLWAGRSGATPHYAVADCHRRRTLLHRCVISRLGTPAISYGYLALLCAQRCMLSLRGCVNLRDAAHLT